MSRLTAMLCLLTALGLLPACSLSKRLGATEARVKKQYAETRPWGELPLRTISWQQALAMLRAHNAEILSADQYVAKAERDTLGVYTDLIPTVSYYGYVNKALNELSSAWNKDEVSQNINVNFSVPTLTQVPYRVYASKATAYAAVKSREGKEHEVISRLYLLVRRRELDSRAKALEQRYADAAQEAEQHSPLDAAHQTQSDAKVWAETARLLGDYSARWNILPETMPHVCWEHYRDRLNSLAPLVVCQYALRLEQAYLTRYSIALRYLPTINTSIYSPSLFSSTGGTYSGTFLSSEDTRLNLNLSYSLDTQMRSWYQYSTSKEDYERVRREVQAGLADHRNKLAQLRSSMDEYETWRGFMSKRMDFLRHTEPTSAAEFIEQHKTLLDMEKELLTQETAGLEGEAAIVLEYGLE